MGLSSSSSRLNLGLVLSLLLVLVVLMPLVSGFSKHPPPFAYHGGPLLTGNVDISLLFYGAIGRVQKRTIRSFLKSLNFDGGANLEPQVSSWWRIVESYQSIAKNTPLAPPIKVHVVNQQTEASCSVGKVLTIDFIKTLVPKATAGKPGTLAVIVAGRDVTVASLCRGRCFEHGVINNQPYIVIGNPETECPGACAWPFVKADGGPQGVTLQPPNGNIGADAMVVNLAGGLAAAVTNPFNNGFSQPGVAGAVIEATTACPARFGTGAFPGYAGKVHVDPKTGGAFNSHGSKGKKFLLPAVWNPRTSSCWTLM